MLPTVADVVAMPAVVMGDPIVLAGQNGLSSPVRWVHVAPSSGSNRLLLGGELLLATGVGWPSEDHELDRYVNELADVGAAGLVLELGIRFDSVPPALLRSCERRDFPLVALRREVRFVSITEAVHWVIIDSQLGALRERDQLHAIFAELSRRGCSTSFVLDQVAQILDRPVVLEDLNHRAVAWSILGREAGNVLQNWSAESRRASELSVPQPEPYAQTTSWADRGWLRTPVEACGQRWGTLVALHCEPPPSSAEVVLERAALTLSINKLAKPNDDEWADLAHRTILTETMSKSYRDVASLRSMYEAVGFRTRGREFVAISRRSDSDDLENVFGRVRAAAPVENVDVICGVGTEHSTSVFVMSVERGFADRDDMLVSLLRTASENSHSAIAVGPTAQTFPELVGVVDESLALLRSAPTAHDPGMTVHRLRSSELSMLMYGRRGEPTMQTFVERSLGPLLKWDAEHQGDLMEVIRAFTAHPGNRKRAAEACHLSRSVFYQRLDHISRLLEVDLTDGRTVATLHVAMLAHSQL